eukprot:gene12684-13986_t
MGQDQSQEIARRNSVSSISSSSSVGGPNIDAVQKKPKRTVSVKQKAKLEDIIVVKDVRDGPGKESDKTLEKLRKLSITYPLIRNVGGVPLDDTLPGIDSDPITEMLLRYQYHLTECADAVSFDQNAISKRMKEIELYSTSVLKGATERQKQMDLILSSMKKFTEIDSLIDRINKNMDKTLKLLQNVNEMFPEKDRIAPHELSSITKSS